MLTPQRVALRLLLVLAGGVLLARCSETELASVAVKEIETPPEKPAEAAPVPKGGTYKIGDPYQINGVWYYPAEDYNYDETGIASWYGPDFHGKFTANGEIFDQNAISAAHRTLPMPCIVRVTNLENGRELVVRINDRGPYVHNRIIDMSRRAAQLLGFVGQGTARVRVQILAEESRELAMRLKGIQGTEIVQADAVPRATVQAETLPAPGSADKPKPVALPASGPPPKAETAPPPPPPAYDPPQLAKQQVTVVPVKATQLYIQAGAFALFDNANRLRARLSAIGPTTVTQVDAKGQTLFRVRIGPIASVDDADLLLEKVIAYGYPQARIVVD